MNILFMLISVSLFIAIIFFVVFIKSVKSGQYDDLQSPSIRMLLMMSLLKPNQKKKQTNYN